MLSHTQRRLHRLGLAAWVAFLLLVLAGLEAVGQGALQSPPLGHPARWGAWVAGRPASDVVFAGLRLMTMGLTWYLLATSAIGVALRGFDLVRLTRLADAVTLPGVRRLLTGAVGLSVSAASLVGAASQAGAATGRGGPTGWGVPAVTSALLAAGSGAVMTRLPPAGPFATSPSTAAPPAAAPPPSTAAPPATAAPPPSTALPPATARLGPPGTGTDPSPTTPGPATGANPAAPSVHGPSPAPWVVRRGDNLWSVAEANLARTWGRRPTDSEVDRYWLRLIEANRSRLADLGNPDLIFAGQVFELPPP